MDTSMPLHTTVIPILPCTQIKEHIRFYEHLGFISIETFTAPVAYAVLQREGIILHFYGSRQLVPTENPSMCAIQVADLDALQTAFIEGMTAYKKKEIRRGIPRLTKIRDLERDRRFTLTDFSGNTFFYQTPHVGTQARFFRTLTHPDFAARFATFYDLLYSKEDPAIAANCLRWFSSLPADMLPEDQAKIHLVIIDLQHQRGKSPETKELDALLARHPADDPAWNAIRKQYAHILQN